MKQMGLKLGVLFVCVCLTRGAGARGAEPNRGSLFMRAPATAPAASTRSAAAPTTSPAERLYAWHVHNMVDAYERVGSRDPKWDEHARRTVATAAQTWGGRLVINADRKTLAAAEQAVAAGCDDALVGYIYARMHSGVRPRSGENGRLHLAAAERLAASGYCAYFKSIAHLRAASYQLRPKIPAGNAAAEQRLEAATAQFAEIGRDLQLPLSKWFALTDALSRARMALGADRAAAHEKVDAAIRDAAPETVVLTVKGTFHLDHAWDARSHKAAVDVTEAGWKGMAERLVLSQKALERAWQLDPSNADAATAMITVELGQGRGRQRMELWFRRAMQADPGHYKACEAKLYYLEPKWHGSPGAMLGFGRECARTKNWEAGLPFILVVAHESLAQYYGGEWKPKPDPAYFRQRAVWMEVSGVFESCLEAYPDSMFHRSWYAKLACDAEQWVVADEQFQLIGEYYSPAIFTQERFETLRSEASEKAKRQQQQQSVPKDGRL